jgi:DNA modification methylase
MSDTGTDETSDSNENEIDKWVNQIHCGDAVDQLTQLPESSVHMCMTSPPYFGLRDYGEDEQIGLEDSLDAYIQELVDVGDALNRVLRPDGSWWLNLGDSYAGSGRGAWDKHDEKDKKESWTFDGGEAPERNSGLRRKNKMLIPHRVAIALQQNGWIVRNDVTWLKSNPMPQSMKDRLNTTTEQIFHLVPERDYWYDLDAIRAPHKQQTRERRHRAETDRSEYNKYKGGESFANHSLDDAPLHPSGKNPGDVFEITTKPYPDAHFAVYPPELCQKPIKATCPPKVCPECGTPYEREVDREAGTYEYSERGESVKGRTQASGTMHELPSATHEGWRQACNCETSATEPGIVLDPFAGAGTTCMVAKNLQRRFIGIDLNDEYVAMAQDRVGINVDNPEHLREDESQSGIETFAADGGE